MLTNDQIADSVREIAAAVLKNGPPPKPDERAAADAGIALVTNLLQNINTIAAAAKGA